MNKMYIMNVKKNCPTRCFDHKTTSGVRINFKFSKLNVQNLAFHVEF